MRHGSDQAWHVWGGTFPPKPTRQKPMRGCACDLPVLAANVTRGGRQTRQTNTRLAREMTTGSTWFCPVSSCWPRHWSPLFRLSPSSARSDGPVGD